MSGTFILSEDGTPANPSMCSPMVFHTDTKSDTLIDPIPRSLEYTYGRSIPVSVS